MNSTYKENSNVCQVFMDTEWVHSSMVNSRIEMKERLQALKKRRGESYTDLGKVLRKTRTAAHQLMTNPDMDLGEVDVEVLAKHYKTSPQYLRYGIKETVQIKPLDRELFLETAELVDSILDEEPDVTMDERLGYYLSLYSIFSRHNSPPDTATIIDFLGIKRLNAK